MGKRYKRWYTAMQEFLHVNKIQTGRLLQLTGFVTAWGWQTSKCMWTNLPGKIKTGQNTKK